MAAHANDRARRAAAGRARSGTARSRLRGPSAGRHGRARRDDGRRSQTATGPAGSRDRPTTPTRRGRTPPHARPPTWPRSAATSSSGASAITSLAPGRGARRARTRPEVRRHQQRPSRAASRARAGGCRGGCCTAGGERRLRSSLDPPRDRRHEVIDGRPPRAAARRGRIDLAAAQPAGPPVAFGDPLHLHAAHPSEFVGARLAPDEVRPSAPPPPRRTGRIPSRRPGRTAPRARCSPAVDHWAHSVSHVETCCAPSAMFLRRRSLGALRLARRDVLRPERVRPAARHGAEQSLRPVTYRLRTSVSPSEIGRM